MARVSWQEIKDALGSLNIELSKKVPFNFTKLNEEKGGRSTARRKGGIRELHNLKSTVNYDKGRVDKGINGDS